MKASKTNWKKVRGMKDSQIRITKEHPEANVRHIVKTIIRHGMKPVQLQKTSISLRVDAEVLEWFKSKGPGYQSRMNAVLKAFKEASS